MKIGFIGIGQMGKGMSGCILNAGFDLTVCDLRKEAAKHLLDKGAKWADTPRALAESCDVVISCLPMPATVQEVVYGADGLMCAWKKGDIYIDMSTNSPSVIRQVAADPRELEVDVLNAPVSGGTVAAGNGKLTIMIGGEAAVLEKARKVLAAMGDKIFHVGDVGCGNVAKLVNNLISLTCNSITAEGFVLGVKAGIDPQVLWDIIQVSTGNNWCFQQYPKTVLKGNFEPGFRLSLGAKDAGLALQLGREYNVPLVVGAAVEQALIGAKAAGYSDKSVDAVALHLEKLTRVQVRGKE